MGISGLLPLLKSIQVSKHLSEFSGRTLAVDAYVWLHRGVYSCATELATGKRTHKYVDYAMHRVRLLRHHGIEPYIVFDGGPLPAKRGTESERKQRREENLARGHALAAQGKHSQARDYYVKCVDVTPQMAYQLIKALKAESVSYVVAPYEADAQLAYLERIGLVDGIITEDSDLLVFGCRNVLFKLDDVASVITSISRADFSSVSDPAGGVSFIGWSDAQFRSMAILSGCDYLPSIPGVGLKTAWSMLKKHKTAEKAVQVMRLEGKKTVPTGYMKQFRLAEKCFLHQRVYDPLQGKLVHLTDVGDDWDVEADEYVGEDMEPSLAQRIAEGEADPISHEMMEDINPAYIPRVLKQIDINRKAKGKAKRVETPTSKPKTPSKSGGILNFFGSNAIIPPSTKATKMPSLRPTQPSPKKMIVGRQSGKRTLVEIMDQDLSVKRARREPVRKSKMTFNTDDLSLSKFFAPQAGPSRNKENVCIVIEDSDCEELDSKCDLSAVAKGHVDAEMYMAVSNGVVDDPVEQEDGYISPSPSCSHDSPDLSSPAGPTSGRKDSADFEVDPVSSPFSPSAPKQKKARRRSWSHGSNVETPTAVRSRHVSRPTNGDDNDGNGMPKLFFGPDLRSTLCGDDSEIDGFDDDEYGCFGGEADTSGSTSPPSPSPPTPIDATRVVLDVRLRDVSLVLGADDICDDLDEDALEDKARRRRVEVVAQGWKERWSFAGKPGLRRSETNVTPMGRHTPLVDRSDGRKGGLGRHLASAKPIPALGLKQRQRRSLTFVKQGEED
ncbi:Rad2 nuclease [Pleurotus pulmonarius]|nr:Rad2 nuclease [Pleurotus pulmonarius]